MRWSHLFVGRDEELSNLVQAFKRAADGKPQIVGIVAESGFGKTRLAQEFYNWLSTEYEPEGEMGYWPDLLERIENNLTVNPDPNLCGRNAQSLPYLWWGLRIPDPGARNEIVSGAMWAAVSNLTPHLSRHKQEHDRRQLAKKTVKVGAEGAISVGADVLGNALTFGLLGIGKTAFDTAKSLYDLRREQLEIGGRDLSPEATARDQSDKLTDTIIADLRRLARSQSTVLEPIPLVILLDDAQWLDKDEGALAFTDALIKSAREEAWPLLLIMTCWEREWRSSYANRTAPAKWVDETLGDQVVMLGEARGLEKLVSEGFGGLTDIQIKKLLNQADGNPRFLDEILMYLDRNPKLFEGRDQSNPLSAKGEKVVSDMGFSDLVLDRVEDAPDYVRRVLALASLQGVTFSPNITQRMAEAAAFEACEKGIAEGENPFGFVELKSEMPGYDKQGGRSSNARGEFRLKAYRDAVFEDLENHIDAEEAELYFIDVRKRVAEDIENASDTDLGILVSFAESEPSAAFDAASELIERSDRRLDTRLAGAIAERMLPLIGDNLAAISPTSLLSIIQADIDKHGPRAEHLALCEGCLAHHASLLTEASTGDERTRLASFYETAGIITAIISGARKAKRYHLESEQLMRALANELNTAKARENLANAVFHLANVTNDVEGPEAALPGFMECEQLQRALASELNTPDSREKLVHAVHYLACAIRDIKGPAAALPGFVECEQLQRALANELNTPKAREYLAYAVFNLADVTRDTKGPEAARLFSVKYEQIMRDLASELDTPYARANLAHAVFYLANVTQDIEGPEAARTLYGEYEQLLRALANEFNTPKARENLAYAVYHLASVIRDIEGPEAAHVLYVEYEQLMRALASELNTPEARENLAYAVSHLASVIRDIEGPEASLPHIIEHEQLLRALANEQNTPKARRGLAYAVYYLANVTRDIKGPEASLPYFIEYEQLLRALASEQNTPEARKNLAIALFDLGFVIASIEGLEVALPHYVEHEQLFRALASEINTPEARENLARAVFSLAAVTWEIEGPEAARALVVDYEQLMRDLADELNTPDARANLALAVLTLANMIRGTEGPEAAFPHFMEHERLMRDLSRELNTLRARENLANATYHLASVTRDIEGPEASLPYFVENEQLIRALASELNTPKARENLAYAVYHLASVIRDIEGPEAAHVLYVEYEQLMRTLASELNTPKVRENLANAIYDLASVTRDIEGPEASLPHFIEHEQLMRALASELNPPKARENLAYAVNYLASVTRDIRGPEASLPYFIEQEQLLRALASELNTPKARENLANAVYCLANVTRDIEGPEAARPLLLEFKELSAGTQNEPDNLRRKYTRARDFLIEYENALLSVFGWSRPFAMELAFEEAVCAEAEILPNVIEDIAKYLQKHKRDDNAIYWLARGRLMLAQNCVTYKEYDKAEHLIQQILDGLEPFLTVQNDSHMGLFVRANLLHAKILEWLGDNGRASSSFAIAQETLDKVHHDIWNCVYLRALVCWYHAKFLRAMGRESHARDVYELGRTAAQTFAQFKARDGDAIVKAFELGELW